MAKSTRHVFRMAAAFALLCATNVFGQATWAVYNGVDTTTQGKWTGTYGASGYLIANSGMNAPSYAAVNMSGEATWSWETPTFDTRALQVSKGAITRIASTFYSTNDDFTIDINLTDSNAHRVALYLLDWDDFARSQTISVVDATTQQPLDTESFSNFTAGQYASWNIQGHVVIHVVSKGGINAAVAGIFFDAAPGITPPVSSATYAGTDTATQGGWARNYGADGYYVSNYASNTPSYATAMMTGESLWTWAGTTSDSRAIQTGVSTAIASAYYGSTFSINLNLTDNNIHTVALYLLDWDTTNRAETISILDAATHAVLSTQSFSNFHNGVYAVWNISGNVIVQVTATAGADAVISGIFFGHAPALTASATYSGLDTSTHGAWASKYGADGSLVGGFTNNSPPYATTSLTGNSLWTWEKATSDPLAVQTGRSTGIASAYYGSNFVINVDIADSKTHQISLYMLDWDTNSRAQTISILDAQTYVVLDTETFSNLHQGVYAVWNVSGSVIIQVTGTAGPNAVVSGIFFGGAPLVTSAATYKGLDTTTQGSWTANYGGDGNVMAGYANNSPNYATVAFTGNDVWTWENPVTDPRALVTPSATEIASAYYGSSFAIDINITDGKSHPVGLYLLDWDGAARTETISILDAQTYVVLDTRTFSNFSAGVYASWNLKGDVIIQVTSTGGLSAVVSGVFFGGAPVPPGPAYSTANYRGLDTTTQGAWSGRYGNAGYIIANGANNTPPYATVSMTGQDAWTWYSATNDPRALQTGSGSANRIASTFYSDNGSFATNLNLTDGNVHKIALYLLDWDTTGRVQTVTILDAVTHTVLNTQSYQHFTNGEYAIWEIGGNVIVQVTSDAGINAVVAGMFFD